MSSSDGRGELIVERTRDVWVLVLRGEHDAATSETLGAELEAIFAHGSQVVVDLSEASFVDSTTLGRLVHGCLLAREAPEHAFAVVAPPGSTARRLFQLVALERQMRLYASREEALRAIA